MIRRATVWAAVAAAMLAMGAAAQAKTFAMPDPPEPTVAELLAAAGVKADDPDALWKFSGQVGPEGSVNVWIGDLHAREREALRHEWSRAAAEAAAAAAGHPGEFEFAPPKEAVDRMVADLQARRLRDPDRLLDALLRQIGKVGRAKDLEWLYSGVRGRTPLGQWKSLAAAEEIIARCSVEELTTPKALFAMRTEAVALALGDIEPEKAGRLALARLAYDEEMAEKFRTVLGPPTAARLRLAYIAAAADPDKALAALVPGLECHDPAIRLQAGLAIAALSDGRVPFCLSLPPGETREARTKWLAGLKVHKPHEYTFADPFDAPLVVGSATTTRTFAWIDAAGKIVREEKDVWPLAGERLPDGTLLAGSWSFPPYLALMQPGGETFSRFVDGQNPLYNRGQVEGPRGAYLTPCSDGSGAAEFGFDGTMLWQAMVGQYQETVRSATAAPRGRFVLAGSDAVRIIDRRGDVVWEIKDPSDPRAAYMIADDTVMVVEHNAITIYNRQKGEVKKVEGFVSPDWVRYHPTRPWIVNDNTVYVYDPATDKRTKVDLPRR